MGIVTRRENSPLLREDPSAQVSGALFHRNEFLLNNCRALRNQQQQQDNKYTLTFLMSSLFPLLSPQCILAFLEELVLVYEILHTF